MYDPLTSTYSFACPHGRGVRVPLSAFRFLECLPGAAHPTIYRVSFACSCGDEHAGLVSHDELDWAPLGIDAGGTFRNLMTDSDDALAGELAQLAASRITLGRWPWSFYCYLEKRPRPVTPSAFAVIAPSGESFGIVVRCPVCTALSVNLVSRAHVDVPYWNDHRVGVVDHVFPDDAVRRLEEFRSELASARFDERRLDLER
jgi:hypothetical protein